MKQFFFCLFVCLSLVICLLSSFILLPWWTFSEAMTTTPKTKTKKDWTQSTMKKTHQNDNTDNSNNRVAIIKKVLTLRYAHTHTKWVREKKRQSKTAMESKTKQKIFWKEMKSFALAETRTRIARVAGEHSTLRPPVLLFIKLFLFIYNTASRHNLCCSLEACTHKIVWLTHSLSLFAFFSISFVTYLFFFSLSLKQTMFYKLYH